MVAGPVMVPVISFLEHNRTSESLPIDQATPNDIQSQQDNGCRVENGAETSNTLTVDVSLGCMSKSYVASNVQLQAIIECSLGRHLDCDLQHSEVQFHSNGDDGSVTDILTSSKSHALLLLSKVILR